MDYTDSLLSYAQSVSSPLIMVIILAIVFSLDPCLMLTNIAAIGYIGREVSDKRKALTQGLFYTLGRTLTYGLLGCVMISLLQVGKSVEPIEEFIEHHGNTIIAIFMIAMGALLCVSEYIPWLNINITRNVQQEHFKGSIGAFLLGAVLTFAFCPTNTVLFFGMMVPICSSSSMGYILPFIFAFTTAIPVIIISYILAFSLNSIGHYYDKIKVIGKVLKWIVAIAFIVIGIYMIISGGGHHHH